MVDGGGGMDFTELIDLIASVKAGEESDPITWNDDRKEDRLSASNISLVISQTEDVHDKIAKLLDDLRELQKLEITVDVRFLTFSDDFFERVGVDFDFDPSEGSGILKYRNRVSQNGNAFVGRTIIDSDLDITFKVNSFDSSPPQFGGFDFETASTFGFAILSDLDVFFLMQASAGGQRANLSFAPKVTLFNGQTATISNDIQRPFVTSVVPVVG